jgi:signal transduction histidine kinase
MHREKLQAVLELAGAVCHELNQPIQAILGHSELLLMDLPKTVPFMKRSAQSMQKSIRWVKQPGN